MKGKSTLLYCAFLLAVLLLGPAGAQAQPYTYSNSFGAWYYITNNGSITVTLYKGHDLGISAVTVPSVINGLPVTTIGDGAFGYLDANDVTSVILPNSVTTIQQEAFYDSDVTNILIGNNVTNIGQQAFEFCSALTGVYFLGNAPSYGLYVFSQDNYVTVYYSPSASGWTTNFAGRSALPWYPVMPPLGIATYSNQPVLFFATPAPFSTSVGSNYSVGTNYVLQMTTNLASGVWVTITNGVPLNCVMITNVPNYAFFRMQP